MPSGALLAKREAPGKGSCIGCSPQEVQQPEPAQPEYPFGSLVMPIKEIPLAMMQTGRR